MQIDSILGQQLHLTLGSIGPVDLQPGTTLDSSEHHPETIPLPLVQRMGGLVLSIYNHEILVAPRTEQSIRSMRRKSPHVQQINQLHEERHLFHFGIRRRQSPFSILHHNHTRSTTPGLNSSRMMVMRMIPMCATHVIFRHLNVVLGGSARLHIREDIVLPRLGRHMQTVGMQICGVQVADVILLFHCETAKSSDADFLHDGIVVAIWVRVLQAIIQTQANGIAWVHPHDGTNRSTKAAVVRHVPTGVESIRCIQRACDGNHIKIQVESTFGDVHRSGELQLGARWRGGGGWSGRERRQRPRSWPGRRDGGAQGGGAAWNVCGGAGEGPTIRAIGTICTSLTRTTIFTDPVHGARAGIVVA
mmetsp:Transcript_14952/g.36143  ORF Transcript_14952/g.36143 Transcript_14952/m.36143 type:complete len:361 (+) Transcript_14952:804-1886(+)